MINYMVRRLIQSLIVMIIVGFIAFALFFFVGDPVASILGLETPTEQREALKQELGLDDPFFIQYGRFLLRAVRGDFGLSYQTSRPVIKMIGERLPATIELSFFAALIALIMGISAGVYTALHKDSLFTRFFMTTSLVGVSLPTFVIGILLILIFSVTLGWLPSYGRGDTVNVGWWTTGLLTSSGWKSIIMPAFSLALVQMTLTMRLIRAEMLEVLRTDYIKFDRARGLTNRTINFGHALKNTLIPVITVIGLQIGTLLAFAIVTETVFQWPGMGLLFMQAVSTVDVPVMTSFLMLVAFFFVIINLIVDLLYFVIDPRIRISSVEAGGEKI